MNRNSWELDEIDDGGRETSVQRLLTKRSRCDYTVSGVHESATGVVAFIAAIARFYDGVMIFLDETFKKILSELRERWCVCMEDHSAVFISRWDILIIKRKELGRVTV